MAIFVCNIPKGSFVGGMKLTEAVNDVNVRIIRNVDHVDEQFLGVAIDWDRWSIFEKLWSLMEYDFH